MDPLLHLTRARQPRLLLRRRRGRKPAVWYIDDAGRLTSTGCLAHERSKAESVLAHYSARLLAGIPNGASFEIQRPSLQELLDEYFDSRRLRNSAPRGMRKELVSKLNSFKRDGGRR